MRPEPVRMPTDAPFSDGRLYLAWTGMETDLIFNRGLDLPGFASHPLVETSEGRGVLREAFGAQIDVARAHDPGVILESPTWTASRDRGAEIGVDADTLARRNRSTIALMAEMRAETGHTPVVLSANVGPRADAYAPAERMTAAEAEAYHAEQIGWLSHTAVDVISGYAFSYPEEGSASFARPAPAARRPSSPGPSKPTAACRWGSL